MKKLLSISLLVLSAHTFGVGWDRDNNPSNLNSSFKTKFSELPMSGAISDQQTGWPGSHWASYLGGIAHRWSAADPQNFKYKLLSLEELKKAEPSQLAELSPAEKFDIYNGDYSYPTVKKVYRTVSPNQTEWFGLCHGYAPAALNHKEPATRDMVNPDGIKIHFYSSDVAGLMAFNYANVASTPVKLIGKRCNYNPGYVPRRKLDECNDLNAGAFHISLTNKLGIEGLGFIADIERYSEVWNHVAVGFQSKVYKEDGPVKTSAYGTVKRLYVESEVSFGYAIGPRVDPVLNTEYAIFFNESYSYFLDLDKNDDIIGGDWVSERRPDFIWTQSRTLFSGEWNSLNDIFQPAVY